MEKAIREYMAALGRKGGKATGKVKVRGGKEYYRRIALKGNAAKRAKKAQQARRAAQ